MKGLFTSLEQIKEGIKTVGFVLIITIKVRLFYLEL